MLGTVESMFFLVLRVWRFVHGDVWMCRLDKLLAARPNLVAINGNARDTHMLSGECICIRNNPKAIKACHGQAAL